MAAVAPTADQRVPVDRRWLGLDRRSLPYALVALVVIALWAAVLPWVSQRVPWEDTTVAGEVFQVTDDVTMVVPPGWGVTSGLRADDDTRGGVQAAEQIALSRNGVTFAVQQGGFTGSPAELLRQAELITGAQVGDDLQLTGAVSAATTSSGIRGAEQDLATARAVVQVTTFVVDDVGIEVQVIGAHEQVAAMRSETDAMIASLTQEATS